MVAPPELATNVAKVLPADVTSALIDHLWQRDADGKLPTVFALVDGARDKRIEPLVNNSHLEHDCLFAGQMSYALRRAAPHIVKLEPDATFTHTLLSKGWGNAWGIFVIGKAQLTLSSVRHHFRRIARVQGTNGKTMLFRYYDPRVFRVFLPTCEADQYQTLTDGLNAVMMEDVGGTSMLTFTPGTQQPKKAPVY